MAQRYATIAEVRVLLPASWTDPPVTDALVQAALDAGACILAPSVWGECASQAHANYAAHKVALHPDVVAAFPNAGQQGLLAGEANGPASRSFVVTAPDSNTDAWLSSTYWGQCYMEIKRTVLGCGTGIVARAC